MAGRRRAGTATQNDLVCHELAVVFAEGSRQRLETWIGAVGACRPFPNIAKDLGEAIVEGGRGVQSTAVAEVARHLLWRRCGFPLRLRRQPRPRPSGEGVGFEEADVADRGVAIDGTAPLEPVLEPLTVLLVPVQGRAPTALSRRSPAFGQPKRRIPIAPVFHECQILAARDGSIRKRKLRQPHLVPGRFVVERESFPAARADFHQAARDRQE